jgi:hypothetical protein
VLPPSLQQQQEAKRTSPAAWRRRGFRAMDRLERR